jgi:hypothetical protein
MKPRKTKLALAVLALVGGLAHGQAVPPHSHLRADGLGKLKIGMPLARVNGLLTKKIVSTPPALRLSPRCDYQALPQTPGVALAFLDGRLARVDISKPGISDEHGIKIGDTLEEAAAKLPDSKRESFDDDPGGISLVSEPGDGPNGMRYQFENSKLMLMIAGDRKVMRFAEGCD